MALVNETARILSNEFAGPRLHLMTLEAPQIAASIEPGQFVHMKVPRMEAHILRRPFSVYQVDADAGTMSVLYQCVGYGTDHLSQLEAPFTLDHRARGQPLGDPGGPARLARCWRCGRSAALHLRRAACFCW